MANLKTVEQTLPGPFLQRRGKEIRRAPRGINGFMVIRNFLSGTHIAGLSARRGFRSFCHNRLPAKWVVPCHQWWLRHNGQLYRVLFSRQAEGCATEAQRGPTVTSTCLADDRCRGFP